MGEFKKYLQWENLVNGWCPACGGTMKLEGKTYICRNHEKNPFVIPESKFNKIVRDIEESTEYKIKVMRRDIEPPPREVEL